MIERRVFERSQADSSNDFSAGAAAATECYIGIGSNLCEPLEQVRRALSALQEVEQTRVIEWSSLYASPPMGPQDQDDYVNAAALIETNLEPLALFEALQTIERGFGRDRSVRRWGPRIIDLDLLLFGDRVLQLPELTVPHPGILDRPFVIVPLLELNAGLVLPNGVELGERAASFPADAVRVIEPRS